MGFGLDIADFTSSTQDLCWVFNFIVLRKKAEVSACLLWFGKLIKDVERQRKCGDADGDEVFLHELAEACPQFEEDKP